MENEIILQIPATIEKVETMRNDSLRLKVDTQENINSSVSSKIMSVKGRLGWLCFLPGEKMIMADDIVNLPELKDESEQKSPSQRLRGVLFKIWEMQSQEYKNKFPSEVYYRGQMEKIIDKLKEKLN